MSAVESPLMQQLSAQMRFMTQRQAVLAQNIANLDTPGYAAKDLKPLDFEHMASDSQGPTLRMTTTSPKHISPKNGSAFAANEIRNPTEVTPTKNNVSLEEEMAKISDTGAQYQISSSLFKKFTGMYRAALGNR